MRETKIFDPRDGFAPLTDPVVVTDSSVVKRGDRWWMYLAGRVANREGIQLLSASLPQAAPLSASGWTLTPDPHDPTKAAMLAEQKLSAPWDLKGGRHCPSYVRGWDPHKQTWVERIYYAGGADYIWGPYTIGYLEWDSVRWVEQPVPAFIAEEDWEHGSVYEPNLIYADGKWKMWYVAGSNHEDYLVHGYAESDDGRTNWTKHTMFAPPEYKMFDFCAIKAGDAYEAVFSRVWLARSEPPPQTGLWWCTAKAPSSRLADWSEPVQIMTAQGREWHSAPFKPSLQYDDSEPNRMFVFFDGLPEHPPHPYALTLGCLEINRPFPRDVSR